MGGEGGRGGEKEKRKAAFVAGDTVKVRTLKAATRERPVGRLSGAPLIIVGESGDVAVTFNLSLGKSSVRLG